MTTPTITRAIKRFEAAVREHEMKGAHDPQDHEAIQNTYDTAREKLSLTIENAITKARRTKG